VVFFAADDLPRSAERVLRVLEQKGPLTHKDLVVATQLPPRTLRFALARLRETDRVVWRWSLRDARQRVYGIAATA
jgi:transcription initiation factor IIE alpha subunit